MAKAEFSTITRLLAVFSIVGATGGFAETLPDALVAAYRNSKLLESSRALLRSRDESVALAVAASRPTLTANTGLSGTVRRGPSAGKGTRATSHSLLANLQLATELLIFDGGDSKLAVAAEKEGVMAMRQSLVETEQQVLLAAANAYHGVLEQQELVTLEQNGLRLIETQLTAARRRFEFGAVTRTDVSLVEAGVAAAKSRVYLQQGQLEIARQNYLLATGKLPGDLEATPPLPELPASLDEAQRIAAQHHPAIMKGKHNVAAARLNVRRAEQIPIPRVYFGGTLGTNRNLTNISQTTDSLTLSVSARMPLYQGGTLGALTRQAIANAEKASLDLQYQAQVVAQRVAIAWARLEIATASISARHQQVLSAELAHQGVTQEARLGERTTLDQLDAEQKMLEARTNLVAAINSRDMAAYAVLEAAGLMTVKHLGLGIPVYNPEENFNKVQHAPALASRRRFIDLMMERFGGAE